MEEQKMFIVRKLVFADSGRERHLSSKVFRIFFQLSF